MEPATMGRVVVSALIENLDDLFGSQTGRLDESEIRRVEVSDALIDTGAFGLQIPMRYVKRLGLSPVRTRMSRNIGGDLPITTYRAVRLTIQGRDCITDVAGVSDDLPVIIGQILLESMDWVVDVRGQKLIGNPEHGGEEMVDIL